MRRRSRLCWTTRTSRGSCPRTPASPSRSAVGGFGRFSLPDGVYEAMQFHFHFPAEHAIDGHIADGELHIVHQKIGAEDNDDLAVIGVLLRVEDEELARNDDAYPLLAELGFLSGLPR